MARTVHRASPLDRFLPSWDARERFQLEVRAPAQLVYETAARFDLNSVPLVRAIFRLRERLMGAASAEPTPFSEGFLAGAHQIGWGTLEEEPGRLFVAGAYCQPWLPNVSFSPLTADNFVGYPLPEHVKIAWTLETNALDSTHCTLSTETRALATSPAARRRFRSYWRWARFGIFAIRWLLLPAIRRQAEARFV